MIAKPAVRLAQELDASSFTVVGCPAADGQGVGSMQVFAEALAGARGDFIVVPGDIAPVGGDVWYKAAAALIDGVADKPVHVLKGALDNDDFESHFGTADRAVLSEKFTLIMLDGAGGGFSDPTLAFLRDTLAISKAPNVIVAFHTPPPNRMSGDAMSVAQWTRFEEAVGVWRKRITLLLAGRNRTYYEDDVDGLRLIVTGGGGASLVELDRGRPPSYHALEFSVAADGVPSVSIREVNPGGGAGREPEIQRSLAAAFATECEAHAGYLLAAEAAEARRMDELANLFRAAAESRLRHALHLHRVLAPSREPRAVVVENLRNALRGEDDAGSDLIAAADMARDPVAARMLRELMASGKNHADLLGRALEELSIGDDVSQSRYYVCPTCGNVFADYDAPPRCLVCGAPGYVIRQVK